MNLEQLLDAVRVMSARPNLTDTFIKLAINNTEGEFNRLLRRHPRNGVRTTYVLPTIDDQGGEIPPTDLLSVPTNLAELVELSDDSGVIEQYPRGAPCPSRGYLDRGMAYQVFPFPGEGKAFYMDYFAFVNPLIELNDINWLSQYFSDLYIYGALKELAVLLKQDKRLSMFRGEFEIRMNNTVLQGDWQNIASTPRVRNVK